MLVYDDLLQHENFSIRTGSLAWVLAVVTTGGLGYDATLS